MLTFLNPLFLWALTALSIPLLLHLFQQRRTVITPFPTLRFLKLAQKRSSSRVRFENILLWLLRSLLLAFLALAFAMPVIQRTAAAQWLARNRRDIIIIIDTSYSMSYTLDQGTALEAARTAAAGLLGTLQPADRACLYLAADTPTPLIEHPTTEHASILQAIRNIEWRHGGSTIDAAIAMALSTLDQQDDERRDREIYVLTDGQALPWISFQTAPDDDSNRAETRGVPRQHRDKIPLLVLLGGAEQLENCWLDSVAVTPPLLMAGQTARVTATIGRTGPTRQITATLTVDDSEIASRSLEARPNEPTTVEFLVPGMDPGTWQAELRLTPDSLACDDTMGFLLHVRERLPALIAGSERSARFLQIALAPGGSADSVRVVDPSELPSLDLGEFETVFLTDALPLSGQAILHLEAYARAGGVVALFPGDTATAQAYHSLPFLPARAMAIQSIPTRQAAHTINRRQHDTVFQDFRFPRGVIPSVAIKRILTFDEPENEASILLTAGSDLPLLMAKPLGRGLVFIFAISAERDWSTLPLTAFFVPIVHQIMRHGAGTTQPPAYATLGREIEASALLRDFSSVDRLVAPAGRDIAVRDDGDHRYVIESLTEPGLYLRHRPDSTRERAFYANSDRDESQLETVSAAGIAEWSGFRNCYVARTPEELLDTIDDLHKGRLLVEPLLWLLLLVALAEWLFANSVLRKQKNLADTMRIDSAGRVSGTA